MKQLLNLDEAEIEQVHAALDAGRKIEAIKMVREMSGSDLKTAKEAVEMVQRVRLKQNPAAASEGHSAVRKSSGCGSVLLVGAVTSLWWLASLVSGG